MGTETLRRDSLLGAAILSLKVVYFIKHQLLRFFRYSVYSVITLAEILNAINSLYIDLFLRYID